MDNFEYSIQISDRDWEEFYSTAEECGLMQVSLAAEEELLLSDTEREDTACSTASSNPKFIRVSLCPSVGNHKEPQSMQVALSPPRLPAHKWTGSSDDVLSGSEGEEEFGSVSRFLCQRETLLSKKVEMEHRTDIPSSETKDNFVASFIKSQDSPVYESLVECMRSLNTERKHQYEREKEDIHEKGKEDIHRWGKEDIPERGKENIHERGTEDIHRRGKEDIYERCKKDIHERDTEDIHGRGTEDVLGRGKENIHERDTEDIHRRGKEDIYERGKEDIHERGTEDIHGRGTEDILGRGKEDIHGRTKEDIHAKSNPSETFNGESERGHPYDRNNIVVASNDPSRTSPWLPYPKDSPAISKDDQSCIMARDTSLPHCLPNGNIPGINYTVEDPKICNLQSQTSLQANLGKYIQLTADNQIDDSINTKSILHNLDNHVSTNNLPHANVLDYDTWDSVLQFTSKAPEGSSAVQQNIPGLLVENMDFSKTKPNIKEPDTIVPVQYILHRAEYTNPVNSQVPATVSGHTVSSRNPPIQHTQQSPSYKRTPLTLPEMYDFFFDDVSESGIVETATNMASQEVSQEAKQEATVYTPDMYEYFFLEEDENTIKRKKDIKDSKPKEPSVNVEQASSPSVTASWPEACEFFFADGPQHQDRERILLTIPSSQAQRATSIFHAIAPKELQEFALKRVSRGRDERLFPYTGHGTSEESNEPTTGSLVPYLSPSRSDACLMFLALASWAVKSSDLQSSDGWKTALLANIGAVSAIRYLRRRRRTWQGPSLEPVEET